MFDCRLTAKISAKVYKAAFWVLFAWTGFATILKLGRQVEITCLDEFDFALKRRIWSLVFVFVWLCRQH